MTIKKKWFDYEGEESSYQFVRPIINTEAAISGEKLDMPFVTLVSRGATKLKVLENGKLIKILY